MPGGRPPKLNQVIGQRPVRHPDTKEIIGHEPVTVIEQIVDDIRTGLRPERAAFRAGIHRVTFIEWEKIAGRLRAQLASGEVTLSKLRKYERDCLEFSDKVHVAEVDHQRTLDTLHEQLARGGIPTGHTVIEYDVDAQGQRREVKRTTREAVTLPDARAIEFRLKHRHGAEYPDPKVIVAGEGEGGAIPVEVRAAALAEAIERSLAGSTPVDDAPGDDEPTDAP